MKTVYDHITPYVTKDGSVIRELVHPEKLAFTVKQSLAEAIVHPGKSTYLHIHNKSEEIYHITAGKGIMTLDDEVFEIKKGDTVIVMPKSAHKVVNTGAKDLKILCCCCPAYSHDDTELQGDCPPGSDTLNKETKTDAET
ncbi:MAG TPA: cupin domain-containing protein [Deltaproteobacteria bacterium]|nr:cupin domain-containing protein [Deltaproteobacteria bacterium]